MKEKLNFDSFQYNITSLLAILNLLLLYIGFIFPVDSVFQFCYNGLHEITESDCIHGIYFKEPITTSCIYYRDTVQIPGKVRVPHIVSTVCNDQNPEQTHVPPGITYFNTTFQQLNLLTVDGVSKYFNLEESGEDCSRVCINELMKNPKVPIIDESLQDRDEILYPDLEGILEEDAQQKQFNRKLFRYVLNMPVLKRNLSYSIEDSQLRIIHLFKKSIEIVEKNCPDPWVTPGFWTQIYWIHTYTFQQLSENTIKDISVQMFVEIMDILNECFNKDKEFELFGSICGMKAEVLGSKLTTGNGSSSTFKMFKANSRSFHWGFYDPYIDAAWAAVDFVHGYCFSSFQKNMNLFHVYLDAMESLFPSEIQKRWKYVLRFNDDFYWNHLTGTVDIKLVFQSINACVDSSFVGSSPFVHRLGRPFIEQPMRRSKVKDRQKRSSLTSTSVQWCANTLTEKESLLSQAHEQCEEIIGL